MPLTRARFQVFHSQIFHPQAVCDATPGGVMLAPLRSKGRGQVDELLRRAVAAGMIRNDSPDRGFLHGQAGNWST